MDDSDFLKDLLGDDYNKYSTKPEQPEQPEQPAQGEADDAERFYTYDISSIGRVETPGNDIPPPTDEERLGVADFKVNFDFDKEYRDVPENGPLRRRRERRTGCLGGILYFAFILCVSLLLASLAWLAVTDVLGFGNADEEINITIPKGFDVAEVAELLHESGLVEHKFLFKLYANFSNADEKIVAGSYTLNKNYDYRAIVQGMTARGGVRVEVELTIPEGYTMDQIFRLFENNDVCSAEELWEAAKNYDFDYKFLDKKTLGNKLRLEGYLFPDSYRFYVGSTPQQAISKLLDTFDREMTKTFTKEYLALFDDLGYTMKDIVIIASMIEREAGVNADREMIASVIYNRLNSDNFPHLEIDATIYYAIAGTDEKFSTGVDSPYNTYKCIGLPPGPIANPGIASIRAAVYPQETDYYFYALRKGGEHKFSKTLSEHEEFVNSDEYGG